MEHIISPSRVEKIDKLIRSELKAKKAKKAASPKKTANPKKTSSMSEKDCMKKSVKEIKKSLKYKSLPRSVGKSKLKKKDLCKEIAKI